MAVIASAKPGSAAPPIDAIAAAEPVRFKKSRLLVMVSSNRSEGCGEKLASVAFVGQHEVTSAVFGLCMGER